MIKNEKQYNITRKKLQEFNESILKKQSSPTPLPAKERLILVSLQLMQEQFVNEIEAYERLRSNRDDFLEERRIDELPDLLIEFKIHSRMTQKEFSQKVGMKEQQLQRYEAENFQGISFKNLLKILHAIGLEVTVRGAIKGGNQSVA
jgi:DNA-binding Xre family transcriptional regulator